MKSHELKSTEGSRRIRNRVGRGAGSSNGKTSARGQRGQRMRSGNSVRPGFGDGQLPLLRRLPKRGFTNVDCKEYAIANLDQLDQFEDGTEVTPALLVETGVVKNEESGIKVSSDGLLNKKSTVKAHKPSVLAVEAINVKGGAHEVI